jgi:hypothetical protein
MRGLLADADCVGQVMLLSGLMEDDSRRELWESLRLQVFTLAELGLPLDAPDRLIWERCCREELVLITANRNAEGPDALQRVIAEAAVPSGFPVITISDTYRVAHERRYAQRAADKLLEYLFDMDNLRGAQRLYIP